MNQAMPNISRARPDFVCIGMQKAGTRWLYDQLASHSNFFMPPVKELHYFDQMIYGERLDRVLSELNRGLRFKKSVSKKEDGAKIAFYLKLYTSSIYRDNLFAPQKKLRAISQSDADVSCLDLNDFNSRKLAATSVYKDVVPDEFYADMVKSYRRAFRSMMQCLDRHERLFTGDITPAYSILSDLEIERMAKHMSRTKVLLIVRNPVDRMVSALQMFFRRNPSVYENHNIEEVVDTYFFENPTELRRSTPSEIFRVYKSKFSSDQFKVFFFDDLVDRPEWLRLEILRFITGSTDGHFSLDADFNKKKNHKKFAISLEAKTYIRSRLEPELQECREIFGDVAKDW